MSMPETAIFLLATAVLVFFSRKSLRHPGSHGFPRFFAWEAILLLLLLNYPHWERDMFSVRQCFSWLFLVLSIYLVAHGTYLLRTLGNPGRQQLDDALMTFEQTTSLVTVGIYRFIRHPLYSSLLFLAWAIFLKDISLLSLFLVLIASVCLYLTARRDESECLQYFGDEYRRYLQGTRMFIPMVF